MIRALLTRPLVVSDPFEPLDAIVILGAPLRDGQLTPALCERIAAATDLYQRGGGALAVATGRNEAPAIAAAMAPIDVLVENEARTTIENARYASAMLRERGARNAWIVSQPFHGRRAAYLFRREGIEPHVWSFDSDPRLSWTTREYAAWIKLLLRRQR